MNGQQMHQVRLQYSSLYMIAFSCMCAFDRHHVRVTHPGWHIGIGSYVLISCPTCWLLVVDWANNNNTLTP